VCYPSAGLTAETLMAKACADVLGAPEESPSVNGRAPVVVENSGMQRLHRLALRVAVGNISVLLLGETGVGKEVMAEAIHRASPRAGKRLLKLNCGALSESLLESELFGHEK